jgi:hypothetical protein
VRQRLQGSGWRVVRSDCSLDNERRLDHCIGGLAAVSAVGKDDGWQVMVWTATLYTVECNMLIDKATLHKFSISADNLIV